MKMKYAYILVEVARRELDSRTQIAIELYRRGFTIVVGEKNQILWNMIFGKYPPGVVLDKCAQFVENKYFDILSNKGFKFTVLDEEGLVTDNKYFNSKRLSKKAEERLAFNFVVGKYLNEMILSQYPKMNNIISGNPRFSMLKPEWDWWYEDDLNEIKREYGNFGLVISSFNPYPEHYKEALTGMREVDEFFMDQFRIFNSNYNSKDCKLILRPHPSDMPFIIPDLIVNKDYNIIPWIKAATFIINAKCTTSIEAFIAGKRAFTWKNISLDKVYKLPNLFSDDIKYFGQDINDSNQVRRGKILDFLVEYNDSPFKPIQIICDKIEEIGFETNRSVVYWMNIQRLLHLKNYVRSIFRGEDYKRILNKFKRADIIKLSKKLKKLNINHRVNDKVIILTYENHEELF